MFELYLCMLVLQKFYVNKENLYLHSNENAQSLSNLGNARLIYTIHAHIKALNKTSHVHNIYAKVTFDVGGYETVKFKYTCNVK